MIAPKHDQYSKEPINNSFSNGYDVNNNNRDNPNIPGNAYVMI